VAIVADRPRIVVAMATYRRPDRLPAAIAALCDQATTVKPAAEILVVDNDPDGGARAAAGRFADSGVRYVHEPEPGISAARNRALAEAGDADALVFIDDDELPTEGWLRELVGSWQAWQCAAVAGPVEREFDGPIDPWIEASGVFGRRRRPSGSVVRGAATSNLLLDMRRLREYGLAFDPRFGLSGGSDTMLTHSLSQRGGRIRWCDEAAVTERVDPARVSQSWVRFRMLRTSNGWARARIFIADGSVGRVRTKLFLAGKAGLLILRGVARYGAGLLAGAVRLRSRGERDLWSGFGLALGCLGIAKYEYRRYAAHGSPPRTVSTAG
jgi:glycosyltransferase involved in cell wall biosynthesis